MKALLVQTWGLVVVAAGGLAASAAAPAASRVAIVSSNQEANVRAVVELSAVRLAEDRRVTVLDRQSVEELLAEQELTLRGIARAEQALIAGRLLKVDLFAVFVVEEDGPRLIVYETATGVRISDRVISDAGVEETAARVAASVVKALDKRGRKETVRLISFHGHRNVDLASDKQAWMERTVQQIQRRLASGDELAVLERGQLHYVNTERMLPSAQEQAHLLAGAAQILLQFSRGASADAAEVTFVIALPGLRQRRELKTILEYRGKAGRVEALADKAAADIARLIGQLTPDSRELSPDKKRRREAYRLRHEAMRMRVRNSWREAVVHMEAALALRPEDNDYMNELAYVLDKHADALMRSTASQDGQTQGVERTHESEWLEAIGVLDYRLQLVESLHQRRCAEQEWSLKIGRGNSGFPHVNLGWLNFSKIDATTQPVVAAAAGAHSSRMRDFWYGDIVSFVQKHARNANEADTFLRGFYHGFLDRQEPYSATPDDHARFAIQQYDRWREALRDRGWDRDNAVGVATLKTLSDQLLNWRDYRLKQFSPEVLAEVIERHRELAKHPSSRIARTAQLQIAKVSQEMLADHSLSHAAQQARIAAVVEELSRPVLSEISKGPSPESEATWRPAERWPDSEIRFNDFYQFRTTFLSKIAKINPQRALSRETAARLLDDCLDSDVFCPALFYRSLPWPGYRSPTSRYLATVQIPLELLAEQRDRYDHFLPRLRAGQGKRSTRQLKQVVRILQSERDVVEEALALRRANRPAASASLAETPEPASEGGRAAQRSEWTSALTQRSTTVETPWNALTLVAGVPGFPEKHLATDRPRIIGFGARGGYLYYLQKHPSPDWERFQVSLFRAPLDQPGSSELISRKEVSNHHYAKRNRDAAGDPQERMYSTLSAWLCRQVAVDDAFLYWNRVYKGIDVFPLNGEEPFTIDRQLGLPSNLVHTITPAAGKLYAWLGRPMRESLFVSVDASAKKVELLASSERATARNGLDNRHPEVPSFAHYDSARDRLVFIFGVGNFSSGGNALWEWRIHERQTSELHRIPMGPGRMLRDIRSDASCNALLLTMQNEYRIFDLKAGTVRRLPIQDSLQRYTEYPPVATALVGNRLWLEGGLSYGLDDQRYRVLNHPLSGQLTDDAVSLASQIIAGGEYCVYWDQHHLWIAELLGPEQITLSTPMSPTNSSSSHEDPDDPNS